jgi:uncharacterized delta-60 repeat protein
VVNALAVTPDGKVMLAGMFNVIAGVPCGGIARLNADGTLDPGFHSDLQPETMSGQTPSLNALAIRDDGSTVIGGNFSSVSGFPRGAVAQLHGDPPAPPVITTQPVSQTVAEGRGVSLFVSGAYSSATEHQWQLAGTNLPGAIHPALELRDVRQADAGDYTLVLRNASGSVTSEVATLTVTAAAAGVGKTDIDFGRGAGVDGAVACSVATLDGKVIIAGLFRHVHGVPRTFIARLHTDGSLDESFDAGAIQLGLPAKYGLGIVALASDDQGRVYLGGSFTNIQGALRHGIARLNPSGQLDTTYAAGTGADATVLDLALQPNGTLFMGGEFLSVEGTQRLGIARLDRAGHLDPSFAPVIPITASTVVYALGLQTGGGILASGDLLSFTGGHLVRFKQNGATDTAFTPGISIDRAPRALTVDPASGRIYLGLGTIIVNGGLLAERILGLNSNGSFIATFSQNGYAVRSVQRLALDSCGRLLVGTSSTNVSGLRRTHLARFHPDGNLDLEFNPTLDGTVTSILPRPWDDSVFVAGAFSFANGVRRCGFAQLLGQPVAAPAITNQPLGQSIATGQELLLRIGVACPPFPALQWFRNGVAVPGATNATLQFPNALITQAGNYVVVVSNIAGVQTSLVATVTVAPPDISPARVDFDFFPGPGPGPDGAVRALALQEDGKLWIGGDFTNVHGIPRQSLARLNRDGSLDMSFDLAALGSFDPARIPIIYALAVQPDGALLFGGTFMFRRNPRLYYDLVRIGANGELDLAFTPGGAGEPETRSLLVEPDGRIIVGRYISGFTALRPADGSLDMTFRASADNSVFSLARTADGQLIGGGAFSSVNSRTRWRVVRLTRNGTVDPGFVPAIPNDLVLAVAPQSDGKVVMGGPFTQVGGQPRNRIARLNRDGTLDAAFNPDANGVVNTLAIAPNGAIYLAGNFTMVGGQACARVARVQPDGTLDLQFNPGAGADASVSALLVQEDGRLDLGGLFNTFDGMPRPRVARLHGQVVATEGRLGALGFSVSVGTATGRTYWLESTEALPAASWNPVVSLAGNGLVQPLTDPSPQAPRFYRVRVE